MAKFCTNCGASMTETAKFCNGCGTRQDDAPPVQQPQQPQPQYQQPTAQPQPQYQQPTVPPQMQYQQPPMQQFQPQPVQQQYQQPAQQAPQEKPKKKRRIPLLVKIIGIAALIIVVGIIVAVTALNNAGKADYFKFGKDQIPSVKLALGEERNMTGASTSAAAGGGQLKVFTYQIEGMGQNTDMFNYLTYLRENDGFLLLTGFDFNGPEGTCVVGRNSVDAGYEIQLQIEYDRTGYVISILKQKGEITPNAAGGGDQTPGQTGNAGGVMSNSPSSEPSGGGAADTGSSPSPEPGGGGTSAPDNAGTTAPDNAGAGGNGSLTKDIFDTMNSGTYHIKMDLLSGDESGNIELYAKNGMTATLVSSEGVDIRLVIRDGQSFIILDDYQIVIIGDADPDDVGTGYFGETDNLTYIGEGSGEFVGKTYKYDEYRDNDGDQFFYYVDSGALKGIRTVISGEAQNFAILAFDKNIPDSIFEVPDDYEIMES